MSTKTTIKRIALVAAVAAAFGGLSTVAANAAAGQTISTTSGSSITTVAAGTNLTSNDVVGSYSLETVTAAGADHVYTITSTGVGTMSFATPPAAPISATANGLTITTGVSAVSESFQVGGSTSATWFAGSYPGAALFSAAAASSVIAFSAYSATAGVQVITVTGDVGGSVTHTITWGSAPVISAANSAVYIGSAGNVTNSTTSAVTATADNATYGTVVTAAYVPTASATILAPKTAPASIGSAYSDATVYVKVKDSSASGGVLKDGVKVTATVTGAGLVDGNGSAGGGWVLSPSKSANSYTASGYAAFQVYPDGTSGLGTITVTYTDSSGNVITLGTASLVFYGSTPAALKATQNVYVGAAGDTISGNGINVAGDSGTGDGAITVSATDSAGNPVAGLSALGSATTATAGWTISSDNTACVTNTIAGVHAGSGANALDDAVGTYELDLTGASGAASGCVANITVGYYISTTTPALTAPVGKFTIGKTTIASIALGTDAASYAPGTKVNFTLTAKDSAGNPVADGYYGVIAAAGTYSVVSGGTAGDLTHTGTVAAVSGLGLNASLPSTPWAAAATPCSATTNSCGWGGIYFSNGVATASSYAPYYSGTVTGTLTLANSTSNTGIAAALEATALTTSFAVTSPTDAQASSATDAANEATDAANAATDAANAAADAADAATSAAQDAGAKADAALAAVTALSAKITVLAAQIAKIVKKLKA